MTKSINLIVPKICETDGQAFRMRPPEIVRGVSMTSTSRDLLRSVCVLFFFFLPITKPNRKMLKRNVQAVVGQGRHNQAFPCSHVCQRWTRRTFYMPNHSANTNTHPTNVWMANGQIIIVTIHAHKCLRSTYIYDVSHEHRIK